MVAKKLPVFYVCSMCYMSYSSLIVSDLFPGCLCASVNLPPSLSPECARRINIKDDRSYLLRCRNIDKLGIIALVLKRGMVSITANLSLEKNGGIYICEKGY